MDNEKRWTQSFPRRYSTDRLIGYRTPRSMRYFQFYSEQVMINHRLHSGDHACIARAMSWARERGYLSVEE